MKNLALAQVMEQLPLLNSIFNSRAYQIARLGFAHLGDVETTPLLIAAIYDGDREQIREQGINFGVAALSALPVGKALSVVGKVTKGLKYSDDLVKAAKKLYPKKAGGIE